MGDSVTAHPPGRRQHPGLGSGRGPLAGPSGQHGREEDGRPERTRTADLYRVKVAL